MKYKIEIDLISSDIAENLCRRITADLPEYFGLSESNEHYATSMQARTNLAARINNEYVGLISVDFPYPNNSNIYWLAILRNYHHRNIGRKLVEAAINLAKKDGATTMTVGTLAPLEADENYIKTYNFYRMVGFVPLFDLQPKNYEWNMVYMIRVLTITN